MSDDYVPPVGKHHMLDVLRAAFGKHALAAYKQCAKLAELTDDPSHSREDYVNIAALYGAQHPEYMNAGAAFVSKAAKQAISESWRAPNSTELNPKVGQRTGRKVEWINEAEEVRLADPIVTHGIRNEYAEQPSGLAIPHHRGESKEQREDRIFDAGARYLLADRLALLAELEHTDNAAWWAYRLVIEGGKTQREAAAMLGVSVSTTQLLIGQRLDLSVQFLTERYAELGQLALLATWRGDVAVARPRAFCVYRYLQGV